MALPCFGIASNMHQSQSLCTTILIVSYGASAPKGACCQQWPLDAVTHSARGKVHSPELFLPGGRFDSTSSTPATLSSCAPVLATTDAGSVARVIAASSRCEYRPPPTRAASAEAYTVPLDALCMLSGLPVSELANC